FAHGFTYSGHPMACAVALENIRILEEEKLVERVADLAPYFAEKLGSLADHPVVGEARSFGLLGAIEIVKNKQTRERFAEEGRAGGICRDACLANDLIMRACRDTMVLSPPFVITREEIDLLVERARIALDAVHDALKGEMD
ncbi:MAG: aminotransferase class III-fold pyridoxal phosphate-dependent enzyme, partial [Pseudomonadota bacterium]